MKLAPTRARQSSSLGSLKGNPGSLFGDLEVTTKSTSKLSSSPRAKGKDEDSVRYEDIPNGGPRRGPVAEVIQAFIDAFELTLSPLLPTLIPQPATNTLARRAIDKHSLGIVLAAISVAPRHRWVSSEFLEKRSVPSLQVLLSDKVLAQLVAEVSER